MPAADRPNEGIRLIHDGGGCAIDLARRELRVRGSLAPVGGRAFDILEALVQAGGQLVTKRALMDRVWRGAIVMDGTLHVHAASIRKALGPYRGLLRNDSGRGYRLLGSWTTQGHDTAPQPVRQQPTRLAGQAPATNLPAAVTSLVGRSASVQKLLDLMSAYRVVTLTGPGGIGKTTLALQVAQRALADFADGGWLIELASLSDPHLVPSAVARVLGLDLGSAINSAEAIATAVADKRLLLVLDNCEQVIDAAARLAETFVRLCPQVTILATSREFFRIEGEYVYRVPSLDVPTMEQLRPDQMIGHSALELFIAKAGQLGMQCPPLPESLPTIAAICRRLDGIPLAIEFAAARAATLGIDRVANGLRDRFALLTTGRRTALPRQRTLYAAFDWSYQLLSADEQQLLRFVSVYPNGFSLPAAIGILTGRQAGSSVIDGISSLAGKSLLNLDETAGAASYRMLETTREYARGRLAEHGEAHAAMQQHALQVHNIVVGTTLTEHRAGDETSNPDEVHPEEIHNVRAALDWCFSPDGDLAIGVAITAAYARTWLHMSLMAECHARVQIALGHLDQMSSQTPDLIMQLYIALCITVTHTTGLVEQTQAALEKILELADQSERGAMRPRALWAIWDYHSNSRDYAKALRTAKQFYAAATESGDRSTIVVANRLLGHSLHYTGEQEAARRHCETVLELESEPGAARTVWFQYDQRLLTGAILARVLWLQGYPDKAAAIVETYRAEAAELGHLLSQCYVHALAAFPLACLTGDLAAAEQALDACAKLAHEHHLPFYQHWCACLRGVLLIERHNFGAGTAALSEALPVLGRVGRRQPEFQLALAKGLVGTGSPARALEVLEAALAHAENDGESWCVAELLRSRSEIFLAQDANAGYAAERQLRDALQMARKQGARSWELRTAMTLAGYLRSRGNRPHEARAVLQSVFDHFTEGFATTDLQAAEHLLALCRNAEPPAEPDR